MSELHAVDPHVSTVEILADKSGVKATLAALGTQGVQLHPQAHGIGFEILGSPDGQQNATQWFNAPIISSDATSVTFGPLPANPTAVRYLWSVLVAVDFVELKSAIGMERRNWCL